MWRVATAADKVLLRPFVDEDAVAHAGCSAIVRLLRFKWGFTQIMGQEFALSLQDAAWQREMTRIRDTAQWYAADAQWSREATDAVAARRNNGREAIRDALVTENPAPDPQV